MENKYILTEQELRVLIKGLTQYPLTEEQIQNQLNQYTKYIEKEDITL